MFAVGLWHIAEHFGTLSQKCGSTNDLRALLAAVIHEIGYEWFALVFGIGRGCPLKDWLWLHNYPPEWEEAFFANGFYARDPILRAGERTSEPFLWSDAMRLRPMDELDQRIMRMAARLGLVHGLTYPFNCPREPSGCCNFVSRRPRILTVAERQCVFAIGSFALAAARRLCGFPEAARPRPTVRPHLVACIELVAMGKEDHEIAQILGITVETARTYVKRVRDLLNVREPRATRSRSPAPGHHRLFRHPPARSARLSIRPGPHVGT